jgi:transposase
MHRISAGDTAALLMLLDGLRSSQPATSGHPAPIACCFEAGRDGFWLHRLLTANEITTYVVEPTSMLVNRRARRAKTDRIDAEGLLRVLAAYLAGDSQIGDNFAVVLAREVFYRSFGNRKQLASYVGLAPMPHQSGDMDRDRRIGRAGNARARKTLVQLAWLWLRYQPGANSPPGSASALVTGIRFLVPKSGCGALARGVWCDHPGQRHREHEGAGRPMHMMSREVVGRLCDSPVCAESANP